MKLKLSETEDEWYGQHLSIVTPCDRGIDVVIFFGDRSPENDDKGRHLRLLGEAKRRIEIAQRQLLSGDLDPSNCDHGLHRGYETNEAKNE